MSLLKIRALVAKAEHSEPRTARRLYAEADEVAIETRPEVVHKRRTGVAVAVGVGQDGSVEIRYGRRSVQARLQDLQVAHSGERVAA